MSIFVHLSMLVEKFASLPAVNVYLNVAKQYSHDHAGNTGTKIGYNPLLICPTRNLCNNKGHKLKDPLQ